MQKIDFVDERGLKRRVLLPDGSTAAPEEGIPVSLDVDELYEHMPLDFRQALVDELWARGLIEPRDFFERDASDRIRAALLSVVKRDTLNIIALAKERMSNG